jgi:uncharacterized protein YkvS
MKTKFIALISMVVLAAASVAAHGDKKHVIGTVEKINSDSVVVKTTDGKSVEVKLVPTTVYVSKAGKEEKPGQLSDLAVGNRVVIHATPKGQELLADTVAFSGPPSKSATKMK